MVAQLATYRPWTEPWESDAAWIDLERQLDVDLVPLAGNIHPDTAGKQPDVTWVLSPSGHWRATVTIPLPRNVDGQAIRAVRGTRFFSSFPVSAVWWSAWTTLNLLVGFGTLIDWRSRLPQPIHSELQEWLSSANKSSEPAKRLPLLPHPTSPLAAQLNELSQQFNSSVESSQRRLARLELVLGNLNEGVLAVDSLGRVIMANPILRKQLGLASEEFVRRPLVEVLRVPRIVEVLEHVLKTGQASEQTIEVGTGGRHLRLLVTYLPLDDGRSGALLTAIDVSSTQRSELARREFIAAASHELKTPLAAIRAYTETLQTIAQSDPDTAQRFLHNILTQADRMDRLVTGMLQLARAESGTMKMKIERIDAVAAIKPCIEAVVGMAQAKNIAVQASIPDAQLLMMADRDAFQTIASNLLSNAVRYTPSGGRIEVELQCLTDSGDTNLPKLPEKAHICLRVCDNGIGIAEADRERIFERFYRVQKDRALESGGTGLGLAIVKQLTEVLSGSVQVTSSKGAGTCFEIRLPAVGFTKSS